MERAEIVEDRTDGKNFLLHALNLRKNSFKVPLNMNDSAVQKITRNL